MALGGGGGGGGSASDVRAGGAFIEIWLKDNMLQRGLDAARDKFMAFGKFVAKIGAVTAAAGASIIAPIAKSLTDFVSEAAAVGKLKEMFGGTTESMSRMVDVFRNAGVDIEAMTHLLGKLSEAASLGADDPAASFLYRLRINAREFIALSPEDKLRKLAEQLEKMPNPADRMRALKEEFGKKGEEAFGIVGRGVDNFNRKMQEAKDNGVEITQEQADMAKRLKDTWALMTSALRQVFLSLGEAILPSADALASFGKNIINLIRQGREWLQANKAIVQLVGGIGLGLLAAGTAATIFGGAVALMGAGIGALLLPLKIVVGLFATILSPFGLFLAASAGLTALIVTQTEAGGRSLGVLADGFRSVKETAVSAWEGISSAMGRGDFLLAGKIALAGLTLEWMKFTAFLDEVWIKFKDKFVDAWHSLAKDIKLLWNDLTSAIAMALVVALETAINDITGPLRALLTIAAKAARAVGLDGKADKLRAVRDSVTADFGDTKQNIKDSHKADEDEINNKFGEDQADRKRFRSGQRAGNNDAIEEAKKTYEELLAKERANAAEANKGKAGDGLRALAAGIAAGISETVGFAGSSTKGLFQAPSFEQSLGIADTLGKRQLIVAEGTLEGIRRIGDLIEAQEALVVE